MTRIIDEGPDPSVVKQVVCPNCGVKLEYVPKDTRHVNRSDYTGGVDTYLILDCPKCSHQIEVGDE